MEEVQLFEGSTVVAMERFLLEFIESSLAEKKWRLNMYDLLKPSTTMLLQSPAYKMICLNAIVQ